VDIKPFLIVKTAPSEAPFLLCYGEGNSEGVFGMGFDTARLGLDNNYDPPPIIADCKTPATAPPPLP
jgi:hypothetical protein